MLDEFSGIFLLNIDFLCWLYIDSKSLLGMQLEPQSNPINLSDRQRLKQDQQRVADAGSRAMFDLMPVGPEQGMPQEIRGSFQRALSIDNANSNSLSNIHLLSTKQTTMQKAIEYFDKI